MLLVLDTLMSAYRLGKAVKVSQRAQEVAPLQTNFTLDLTYCLGQSHRLQGSFSLAFV